MPQFDGFGELGVKHFRLEVRQPRIILFVQIWHNFGKKIRLQVRQLRFFISNNFYSKNCPAIIFSIEIILTEH